MAIDFPNSPSVNDQYTVGDRTWTWNGTYWQTSTSMSTFTASDSEPVDSDAGDIWFDSTIGKTFVNYDGNWVEIGAAGSVVDVIADADADTKIQVESSADSDKIEFTTAGTKRLEIDASGHIIPAANETYDLGSASARFRDIYLSGASIDLGGATISSDGTNLTMPPVSNISGDFTVGTDVLHVDHANSSVGIGTSSPAAELDVSAAVTPQIQLTSEKDGTWVAGDPFGEVNFYGSDTSGGGAGYRARIRAVATDTFGYETDLAFHTTDVPSGDAERMRITDDGKVGIGTTAPSYLLDVNGQAEFGAGNDLTPNYLGEGHLMISGNGYRGFASLDGTAMWLGHNSASRKLYLATDETARLTVDGTGNVGIGTTSPSSLLELSAPSAILSLTDSDGTVGGSMSAMVFYKDSAGNVQGQVGYGTGVGFMVVDNNDGPMRVGTASADSLYLRTNNANRIAIDSSGNVGIGDDTPSYKLEVNGEVRGNEVFNQKVGPSYPSSAGWYTIATCSSGRASGLFNVHDPRSAYHGALTFYINHLYGQETITLLNHNYYSGSGPITAIRVKGNGVYDGAAVQVYFQVSSGGCEVFLSENYGEQTWGIKNFIPDGTDPGGQSGTWSSFTQQQYLSIAGIPRGSTYTSGTVYGASKSFAIPHPTREDYILNHGAIEGPENGVYHRGRCVDGTIVLPEYWDGLVDLDTVTVQLTPIGEHSNWVSSISGREVSVGGGECFYIAYGERIDIDPLVVESPMYPDVPPEIEGGP